MDTEIKKPALGSTEETNRLLSEASKQTGIAAPTFTAPTAISSETLSSNQNPVVIPPTQVSTTAEGISGLAQVQVEQAKAQKEQEAKAQEAQAGVSAEKQSLTDTMKSILGIQASRPQLEEQAGLGVKAQKVTDVTNQIEASQRAQTNELRALDGMGLTDVQKSQQSREINRRYAFEQADLALIQSAANRDLDTASRIIDRKIQLQLEPLQQQLEFTKFFYQENKADLTKAEDRAFTTKINSLNQQYETEKQNRTAIANIQLEALKNGVNIPASVMTQLNTAKDAAEATSILASNGISLQNPLDLQEKQLKIKELQQKLGGGINSKVAVNGNNSSYYDALANASLGLPENQRAENTARLNSMLAKGDTQAAKELIIRSALANQTGTAREDSIRRMQAIDSLKTVKTALDEYTAKTGDTGLVAGNIQALTQKLGKAGDPELAKIGTKITQALQVYRNAITGAAWGEQETGEYKQLFPSWNNTNKLNGAIIDSMTEALDGNQRILLGSYIGQGTYDEIFSTTQQATGATSGQSTGASDDDAYQIYLESTGQTPVEQPAAAPVAPTEPRKLESLSGLGDFSSTKPFSLGSFFRSR